MTEQEAEALAARLTRVWTLGESPCEQLTWKLQKYGIRFEVQIDHGSNEHIEVTIEDVLFWTGTKPSSSRCYGMEGRRFTSGSGWEQVGMLSYNLVAQEIRGLQDFGSQEQKDQQQQFAAQWLPFFRRGCWLSGCPIEASAREKAEWMQGFSREELQTWNLKM